MTSAKRTPRYVGIIGAEPMGPHLMGPQPLQRPAADPVAAGRRTGILPMHPPGRAASYTPVVQLPVVAPLPRMPRARVVPVERRPWQVMIVSASPGVAPRSFQVRRWQARVAITVLGIVTTLAFAAVAAVVVAVRSPELLADGLTGEALRNELEATRDSLAVARASATGVATESGDGEAAAEPAVAPVAEAPKIAARPKPLAPRPREAAARPAEREIGILSAIPRSFADLPVIGAIASGFSRARRHPILHRTRPHLGVDVAAPRGTRVSAPAPGRVQFVGRKVGFGLVVELDHGGGITTRYAHLRSAAVQVGEVVTKGEAIAAVGTSGLSTGPHLHYEVLEHGRQVDPLRFRFGQADAPAVTPVAATAPQVVAPVIVQPVAPPPTAATHEAAAPSAPSPR